MPLPLSQSHSLEDPSSSHTHAFISPDLTGQIKQFGNQYCAAGSFGDVYRCQYHSECGVKEVAVKTFRFEFTVGEEDTSGRSNRMIRRELGIWRRLSHPNIVPFLGTVSGFGRFGNASLVSSWMPNGTLQDFLLKYDDKLTVAHRLQFLLGIANGLQYLHSLSIVHGDLTCNNVLLDEKHNTRLTDFGYASLVGEIPEALVYLQASTLRPGAVRWAAPEYFFLNPEEMFYCTTKSDIYSFGNIALQVLSGELPWSEFRRDVVIVLHLAKGHKPRRPQSHPIDDQHWDLIEHCWLPAHERPSAEHLVFSILDFLRSYPQPQRFFGLLVSSEKSNPQSTMSGPLLSPPTIEQFSHDVSLEVPRTFEDFHLMAPNRQHDQLPAVGGLSPPKTTQYPPQLIPDSNSSTLPLLSRNPHTHSGPEDDHGNEATAQAGQFQYTPGTHNQSGSVVNPDVSVTDTVFPKRPPPAHSKSSAASPPFLNTSLGQDQLNTYPFLYPPSQQHSIHHPHLQGTTAFGRGNRGAASESRDGRGGIWSFLFGRSIQQAQNTPIKQQFSRPIKPPSQFSMQSAPTFVSRPICPTPPLHPRIEVGRSHAEPIGVDPAEMMRGVLLKSQSGSLPAPAEELLPQQLQTPLPEIIDPAFFSPASAPHIQFLSNPIEGSAPHDSALEEVFPKPQQEQRPSIVADTLTSFIPQFNLNSSSAHMSAQPIPGGSPAVESCMVKPDSGRPGHDRLTHSEDMTSSLVYPPSSQQESIDPRFLYPQETVHSIRGHSPSAPSGSRGGGDGTWSALASNRPSPYPSPSASPRVRYEDLPNVALSGRPSSMLRPDSPQPNSGGLIAISKQTVTSERTAGASHRRRKQDANFLCPVPGCGSTFTRSFNLKGHMKSHNQERPFQCKWPGCDRRFFRQDNCERHEQLHSRRRHFTCEGCNKTFARMDAMNRHCGAECQRILDATKDSERLPVPKTEEKGWPGMSVMV